MVDVEEKGGGMDGTGGITFGVSRCTPSLSMNRLQLRKVHWFAVEKGEGGQGWLIEEEDIKMKSNVYMICTVGFGTPEISYLQCKRMRLSYEQSKKQRVRN